MTIPTMNFDIKMGNSGVTGNAAGIQITLKDTNGVEEDLTGSEIVFITAESNSNQIRKTNAGDIQVVGGAITIPITVAESRLFRAGSTVQYEIEQRIGDAQRTRLEGVLQILDGINDD